MVVSIFFMPFAYVVLLLQIFWGMFKRRVTKSQRLVAICDFAIHLVFGWPLIVALVIKDWVKFVLTWFKTNLPLKSDYITQGASVIKPVDIKIDKEFYILFIELLKLQDNKVVTAKKLILNDLSRALQIPQQVHKLLFQQAIYKRSTSIDL